MSINPFDAAKDSATGAAKRDAFTDGSKSKINRVIAEFVGHKGDRDYFTDLNAIREAEEHLTQPQVDRYVSRLMEACWGPSLPQDMRSPWDLIHLSPETKAKCLFRVILTL